MGPSRPQAPQASLRKASEMMRDFDQDLLRGRVYQLPISFLSRLLIISILQSYKGTPSPILICQGPYIRELPFRSRGMSALPSLTRALMQLVSGALCTSVV